MAESAIARLLAIMRRLRDPDGGCPWDLEQDFRSIAPYTIEEAYEVADAIAREDPSALKEELGDLLLQVVYHSRMAEERGWFDFREVAEAVSDKMVRRHPHVFGNRRIADAGEQRRHWEELKAQEQAATSSLLDGLPRALPALLRARKLQERAARVGFDWPDAHGVLAKVEEELGELRRALAEEDRLAARRELGDLLFSLVNLARWLEVDAEDALREANRRFEQRFRTMEELARTRGTKLSALDAQGLESLWQEAKLRESGRSGNGD